MKIVVCVVLLKIRVGFEPTIVDGIGGHPEPIL